VSSLEFLGSLVLGRGVFPFLPLNWGRVVGRPKNNLGCMVPAYGDRDVCEKGGELIWPNYTLENFAVLEENVNSLVLTYCSVC
jgi:hypothetical protein